MLDCWSNSCKWWCSHLCNSIQATGSYNLEASRRLLFKRQTSRSRSILKLRTLEIRLHCIVSQPQGPHHLLLYCIFVLWYSSHGYSLSIYTIKWCFPIVRGALLPLELILFIEFTEYVYSVALRSSRTSTSHHDLCVQARKNDLELVERAQEYLILVYCVFCIASQRPNLKNKKKMTKRLEKLHIKVQCCVAELGRKANFKSPLKLSAVIYVLMFCGYITGTLRSYQE